MKAIGCLFTCNQEFLC